MLVAAVVRRLEIRHFFRLRLARGLFRFYFQYIDSRKTAVSFGGCRVGFSPPRARTVPRTRVPGASPGMLGRAPTPGLK